MPLSMGVQLLPPGFRFHPTDEELILYYLRNKVKGAALGCFDAIQDCDLYGVGNKEPWNLFGTTSGDNLYVYTKLIKKKAKAKRVERTAGCGTWKLQRSDEVKVKDPLNKLDKGKDVVIGFKKLLVFEVKGKGKGKGGGSKNNINAAANVNGHWIMHELSLADDDSGYVVCDIRNKNAKVKEDRGDYSYYSYYGDEDDIHGIDQGQGEVENPTLLLTDHQQGDNKNMQDCQAIEASSQISNMQQQQQYIHVNVQDHQANEYSTQSQSESYTHTNDQAQKCRKRDEQEDDQDQLLHQQKRFKPLISTTDAFHGHQQNPATTLSVGEVEETGNNVFEEQLAQLNYEDDIFINANAGQGWAMEDQSATGGSTGNLVFEDSQFNADHSVDNLINPQDLGPIFVEDFEFGVDGNNLMLEDIDFGVGADVDQLDNVMIQGGTTLDDIRKFMEEIED